MIDALKNAYAKKTVWVTGHTGFKGAWLTMWLRHLGAEVVGFSLEPPSRPNLFEAAGLARHIKDIRGDVRDLEALKAGMAAHPPDAVFHLAAQPLVRASYADPVLTYSTNVMGTVNVLEAVRHAGDVGALVNVTSDKCYENREWIWGYRENDPMGGYDPYSSSKGCAELVTAAYIRSFFSKDAYGKDHQTAVASARAGNVIGGGDWGKDRLVPDCVRALSRGEDIKIRYPDAIRPWQHVLDPLSGYLLLGARLLDGGVEYSGAWNFGPAGMAAWNVRSVVEKVVELWGGGRLCLENQPCRHEAHFLQLDCAKALNFLEWRAIYDVEAALEATVEWYRLFYGGASPDELMGLMFREISDYEALFQKKAQKRIWSEGGRA